jgi:hypothetical protein
MRYTEEKIHLSFQTEAFMTKHLWEDGQMRFSSRIWREAEKRINVSADPACSRMA